MPRRAPNMLLHLELDGADGDLARLHLGEIEEVVDELGEVVGRLADERHLLHLLRGERRRRSGRGGDGEQRGDGVERGAELVAHVRQEARLELVGAPEVIGLLVQLGVEGDHAAVGVFELAVEVLELLLPPAELIEGLEQLLVLPLHLLQRLARHLPREASPRLARRSGPRKRRAPAEGACGARPGCPCPGAEVISNWSMSRRAPMMPSPMPVEER